MITKSKKAKGTVFYVPLTRPEGRQFISLLKEFLNTGEYRILIRGRNEDRQGVAKAAGIHSATIRQDVPLKHATYAAVYVDGKTTTRIAKTQYQEWYDKINKQRDEIARLTRRKQELELKEKANEAFAKLAEQQIDRAQEIILDHTNLMVNPPFILPPSAVLPHEVTWRSWWADLKTLMNRPVFRRKETIDRSSVTE
jgi:hypothetical protein